MGYPLAHATYEHFLTSLRGSRELDELLSSWLASQGGSVRDAQFCTMVESWPWEASVHKVLDLFCGPGDLGRTFARRFPLARIDCLDRDPFLLALCTAVNESEGVNARAYLRDGRDSDWHQPLAADFDPPGTSARWS
jgi:hypothetical protein